MFQWAVSLEITGACPAPGRFSSELLNPLIQGPVISKDTKCLLQHIPPMAKRIPNQAACPAANALVQRFPSVRWLAGIRFPHSFSGPDRQVAEDAPEHLN